MKIFIDHREMRSRVADELVELGAEIEITTLEIGDYVVSDRVAFERKTVDDIFSTLLERRELLSQRTDLARSYRKPILIIEGEDMFFFSVRRMNLKAIQGFLNTIALMRIPTLYTLNEAETAQVISMIASKEQNNKTRPFNLHGKRSRFSQTKMKEYIVASLPGIGQVAARNLLNHFGSVENVLTAQQEELMKVERVGLKTAKKIREIAGGRYEPD